MATPSPATLDLRALTQQCKEDAANAAVFGIKIWTRDLSKTAQDAIGSRDLRELRAIIEDAYADAQVRWQELNG